EPCSLPPIGWEPGARGPRPRSNTAAVVAVYRTTDDGGGNREACRDHPEDWDKEDWDKEPGSQRKVTGFRFITATRGLSRDGTREM
ncbi:hypothetical protein NHX12_034026, partial [Muraenolepis orangiensis]